MLFNSIKDVREKGINRLRKEIIRLLSKMSKLGY